MTRAEEELLILLVLGVLLLGFLAYTHLGPEEAAPLPADPLSDGTQLEAQTQVPDAPTEPEHATDLQPIGTTFTGQLDVVPDVRLPLTLARPGTLRITATGEGTLRFRLYLYDVDGTTTLAQDTTGHESSRAVEWGGLAPGQYFIHLHRTQGEGAYTIQTHLAAVAIASDEEPNDTVDQAQRIPLGEATTGLLGFGNADGTDTEDWFKVTTTEPGTLRATVEAEETLSVGLRLYDVNGSTTLDADTSGRASSRAVEQGGLAPGTYFIRLDRSHAGGYGGYHLWAYLAPDAPLDDPAEVAPPIDTPPEDDEDRGADEDTPPSFPPDSDIAPSHQP